MLVSPDSPQMTQICPKLELSPDPSLEEASIRVSASPPLNSPRPKSHRRRQNRAAPGDTVLLTYLGGNRNPEIALQAGLKPLPRVDDEEDDYENDENDGYSTADDSITRTEPEVGKEGDPQESRSAASSGLQVLATDALQSMPPYSRQVASVSEALPQTAPDISLSTSQLSIRDDQAKLAPPRMLLPSREPPVSPGSNFHLERISLPSLAPPGISGELPPIQAESPRSDLSGQSLPSISSQLGDMRKLWMDDRASYQSRGTPFPGSPPGGLPRLGPINHASPPLSPHDLYGRNIGSPPALAAVSTQYYASSNAPYAHRRSADYSSGAGETPSTDQSGSTPATSAASVTDPMSIDHISTPGYVCTEPGCISAPFQTQYLLNSHLNVHSSARPHYCPVPGCPRGETGRGFKRKNEMIRHGLVHDSPGYVCPFCPDREHKYPRPDNLQRYVCSSIMHYLLL